MRQNTVANDRCVGWLTGLPDLYTNMGENAQNYNKIYQIVIKYIKWP
jgi:hypothetical protein